MELDINRNQFLEIEKLALGAFDPLSGFMNEDDFNSCVNTMRLTDGNVFPIPIVFDVTPQVAEKIQTKKSLDLRFENEIVATLHPESLFTPNKRDACVKVFGTDDSQHPGVKYFFDIEDVFVGGEIELHKRPKFEFASYELTPQQTKAHFEEMGWKTIVGFQTRNIPHAAHEYLQKTALETVDGILLQPLVGRKKAGDFSPLAIISAYETLIKHYYPEKRAKLAILSTLMRYAGPREAIFHAIVRRNYGCTHFIIGRDHAGIASYYDTYAAHRLADKFQNELGIQVLKLHGPYWCCKCGSIVTEKTCPHALTDPNEIIPISGTHIRDILQNNKNIDYRIIRPEIIKSLKDLDIFIK